MSQPHHRCIALLASISALPAFGADALTPLAALGAMPPAPWTVAGLPQQSKPFTRFELVDIDTRRALRIESNASYGNLVHALRIESGALRLAWQWRVDEPVAKADLRTKEGDDTAVKVCAFFDQPLARIPFVERQVLRLARSRTGEELPAATLCYVWDAKLPAATVLANAYTRRVRYLVLRGPETALQRWVSERRDLAADFMQAFGDESENPPALTGIGIGADADNTLGRGLAYVADIVLDQ